MSQLVQYTSDKPAKQGEAEEEWVTTKKVDIVTTKSVERKIQRQIVLEDGRVVEEEVPTVTVDTTEDKQTFQTDQDEEREVEEGQEGRYPASRFDGSVLVGDKFTRVKKINDITESLVKTEALQNLGDIRSKDVKKVLDDKNDIRKYLRSREQSRNRDQVIVAPKVLLNKRNHRVVTDQEDVQERNWMNKGKMQNERIKTEEHIEYDSDDSSSSGSSSKSSKSSRHKLEPEVYKTRKDENFTEYFKIHKSQPVSLKVGEGPHYVSESKEVHRVDDPQLLFQPDRPSRASRQHRTFLMTDFQPSRRPLNHTDSWLEKHFGSTSSLSASGSSMELSRPGSRDGPGGLRRSNSICDIRPLANGSNEFYATVRKSGKVPEVKLREKPVERNNYSEKRMSANFSSSGHPVRPPRRQKQSEYGYSSLSRQAMDRNSQYSSQHNSQYSSLRKPEPSPTEKYYFGGPVTIKKYPSSGGGGGGLTRSYSSVQNINSSSGGSHYRRPDHYNSTGNIYKSSQVSSRRNEPHHLMATREKSKNDYSYRNGNNYESKDRAKYPSKERDRERYQQSKHLQDKTNYKNYQSGPTHYSTPVKDIYSVPVRQKERGQYSSQLSRQTVPHKIIYDTPAPARGTAGSPFTKFRTRIVINSES